MTSSKGYFSQVSVFNSDVSHLVAQLQQTWNVNLPMFDVGLRGHRDKRLSGRIWIWVLPELRPKTEKSEAFDQWKVVIHIVNSLLKDTSSMLGC
jgi:hypothetical protein